MQYTPDDESSVQRIDDGEYDDSAIKEGDERAQGRTWFDPDDATVGVHMSNGPDQNKWEWLRDLNDGSRSSNRSSDLNIASRVMDAEFVSEECLLGDREKQTIKRIVKNMDFKSGFAPYVRTEDIVLAIVYYVGMKTKNPFDERRLYDFADQWDVDTDDIVGLQNNIRKKIA